MDPLDRSRISIKLAGWIQNGMTCRHQPQSQATPPLQVVPGFPNFWMQPPSGSGSFRDRNHALAHLRHLRPGRPAIQASTPATNPPANCEVETPEEVTNATGDNKVTIGSQLELLGGGQARKAALKINKTKCSSEPGPPQWFAEPVGKMASHSRRQGVPSV